MVAGGPYTAFGHNISGYLRLADYVALKRLAIPAHLLNDRYGTTIPRALDHLPQQLEELQLQHCADDGTDVVIDMDMRVLLHQDVALRQPICLQTLKHVVWWHQGSPIS